MRFIAAMLSWLIATAMLAVAVPAAWAQRNLFDTNGYAALTQRMATDPVLQTAVAAELTTAARTLINARGYDVDPALVRDVAAAYTAGPSFPQQFAQANRLAHDWLFSDAASQTGHNGWFVDLAPMLNDPAFEQLLGSYLTEVPSTLTVRLTPSAPELLRPGQLRPLTTWGRWVSVGATVLTGVCALLVLLAARDRGKALTGLGVSALLVGAGDWAGVEVARRYINAALNQTAGDTRQIADVMVADAVGSLHQWLSLTLGAGSVLTVVGTIVAVLGGLRRS